MDSSSGTPTKLLFIGMQTRPWLAPSIYGGDVHLQCQASEARRASRALGEIATSEASSLSQAVEEIAQVEA